MRSLYVWAFCQKAEAAAAFSLRQKGLAWGLKQRSQTPRAILLPLGTLLDSCDSRAGGFK